MTAIGAGLSVGACSAHKGLPPANAQQVARSARDCGLKKYDWTTHFFTLDGAPDYPGEPALSFYFPSSVEEMGGKKFEMVEAMQTCLKNSLARQGVGANIFGGLRDDSNAGEPSSRIKTS